MQVKSLTTKLCHKPIPSLSTYSGTGSVSNTLKSPRSPKQKTPLACHIYSLLSPRTKKKLKEHLQLIDQLVYQEPFMRN